MKKPTYLNLGLIAFLLIILLLNVGDKIKASAETQDVTVTPGRYAATNKHYEQFDIYREKAFEKTRLEAKKIEDDVYDLAESAGQDPEEELKINLDDFLTNNNKNYSSIEKLLSILPAGTEDYSASSVIDIAFYLKSFYNKEYDKIKNSSDMSLRQMDNEALVTAQGDDIFKISEQAGEDLVATGPTLKTKEKSNKLWIEQTKTMSKKKENFPKVPKVIAPVPPSVAHCITTGMDPTKNPTLETIDKVDDEPVPLELSKDYFERQLLDLSIKQGKDDKDAISRTLRESLTKVLKTTLEDQLNKYYASVNKQLDAEFNDLYPADKQQIYDNISTDEQIIVNSIYEAFEFQSHLQSLKLRHDTLEKAMKKILEVNTQMRDLSSIEKGDVKNDSNKMVAL